MSATPHTLIRAALLADGLGGEARPGQEVLVRDGRIAAVGSRLDFPPETQIIDLGSACLTPGLIDGHTHLGLSGDGRPYAEMFAESDEMMVLIGARNLQLHRDSGITTLREHGARNQVGFVLKEGVRRGLIPGPRLQVSGRPITCTGGHFYMCNEVADGEDQIRRSVRRLVHEGADYIKIMASGGGTAGTLPGLASYTTAELSAAVHEAHYFHRLTAAHCRAKDSMRRAVEAGIDLMEHAEFLDPDGELRFDPELAAMMAECGIWISPTLQAWTRYGRLVELRERRLANKATAHLAQNPRFGVVKSRQRRPQWTREEEQELQQLEARAELRLDLLRRLLDYQGMRERLVPGTDSGAGAIAFGHLDYDLQLLHQTGLTPGEALVCATRISAAAIGAEKELGTIEVGKVADLTAFDGDPTRDISAFSRVVAVFQEGVRVR